jgi:hypothetical protein
VKGIVFNLLERVVTDAYGEQTWDDVLEKAGVGGAYTSLGSYPDEELLRCVEAGARELGEDPRFFLRWFARKAFPMLAETNPQFLEGHADTRSFLLTLNDVIHPEVRKIYPDAVVPEFDFDASVAGRLDVGYRSPRRMCAFAEGLIEGAARHFGDEVRIEQPECMWHGDDRCLIRCTFTRGARAGAP